MAADNLLRLSGYFGGDEGRQLRRRAAAQLAAAFAAPEAPQAYPELTASLVTGILGPKQVHHDFFFQLLGGSCGMLRSEIVLDFCMGGN